MSDPAYERPPDDELTAASPRSFGITFAVVFALYGSWPLWSSSPIRLWSVGVAMMLLVAALAAPRVLAAPSRAWQKVGLLLHRVVNPVVMGVLFYGVVTPFAALVRMRRGWTGRFHPDRRQRSYWIAREHTTVSMRQQF